MYLTPVANFRYLFFSKTFITLLLFATWSFFLIRMENKQICKKVIKDLHGKKIQGKKGTASTVAVFI